MNAETSPPTQEERAIAREPYATPWRRDRWLQALAAVALVALLACLLLWQKLSGIQQQLARQSAESGTTAVHALTMARQAQEQVTETAAKQAVTDAKVSEVALQRSQLEELMQSLSRSRDENLVVDIESAVRLAQQQAQLTGSVEPLLAALRTAEVRLVRASQPRLAPLQRAIAKDLVRVKSSVVADLPALLVRLDELVSLVDELSVANAVGQARTSEPLQRKPQESLGGWWMRAVDVVHQELRALVRISRIEEPDAALLSPEQAFFLHENLKLRLLNARLGLISRQSESARSDIASAAMALARYFDAGSRKTQTAAALMQQIQSQMKQLELPRVDDTLVALSTAAAGR